MNDIDNDETTFFDEYCSVDFEIESEGFEDITDVMEVLGINLSEASLSQFN